MALIRHRIKLIIDFTMVPVSYCSYNEPSSYSRSLLVRIKGYSLLLVFRVDLILWLGFWTVFIIITSNLLRECSLYQGSIPYILL